MEKIKSKTIVFITGAYVSNRCWDDWNRYFQRQGYTTVAPSWPQKEGDPAALRGRQPNMALAAVDLPQVLDSYISAIKKLPEKPILIGHSFGGMITQVLLNKGYGVAGVAIHAVPPKGVFPYEINFLKSNTAALGFFSTVNTTYLMPFKTWQFAFTNGMSLAEQQTSYEQLTIPESRRAIRGALSNEAKVDFKKPQGPLLILAGSEDQCIPPGLCERVYARYNNSSVVDFKLKKRNHYVLGLPTWKEDADEILQWITQH
ncbi:alpha/beta hydrolase [Chitinophaga pinensis]|uniref:AB hydrolase-1 domain-containing protein n=1 Tax=Chitinophaga pinensis (strain ATCC 43595 / DSM 2588 / LMG 13176 / NBRC 15968 / NCIMB 11800 / UQM 2034) TaxID=485918 RepID=A0A979G191_CHIPD|nr:alpha/beta hydrolase [Chitinophaga pinensis]ACU58847.1 conserved hypothetical protein [Chitinophaga pinensis DSM 2588]